MTDDDDPEAPRPTIGEAASDIAAEEHDEHPAAWFYLPDITQPIGWGGHRVPRTWADPKPARRMGFGR